MMWKGKKVKDFCYVTDYVANGSFASLKGNVKYQYSPSYAILLRVTDFSKAWNNDYVWVDKSSFEYLRKSEVMPSDLIMANVGEPGKCFIAPNLGYPMTLGPNSILIRPHKQTGYPKFLYYYFLSEEGKQSIERISSATAQKKFNKTSFRELDIPLPSIKTQERIIMILDKADEFHRKNKAMFAQYDVLLQSIFYSMFGDKMSNEKGWERGVIRDVVCDVKYGTSKPAEEAGNYVYLRMNNITYNGEWDLSSLKYINLTQAERNKYTVRKGDLIFNRTNSKELVGKTAVYNFDQEMAIAGYLIRVRTSERADPYYLSGYLNSRHGKLTLKNMCKDIIGMANINAQELQGIKILIPPLELQSRYASIVKQIDYQKQLVKQQITQSENLFQSLLQKAFKGELVR